MEDKEKPKATEFEDPMSGLAETDGFLAGHPFAYKVNPLQSI